MTLLENYLNYLQNEQIIKNLATTSASGVAWGVLWMPAALASWKAANVMFSQATRKCGGLKKSSPGFKVCVAREKIKALTQKIAVAKKMLAGCNTAKSPDICKEKFSIEIEKAQNRIEINQNKIKETLGEQQSLEEQAAQLATLAVGIAVSMVVDKAIFAINRSVQATFSQAVRKCGVYKSGPERDLCMSKIKVQVLSAKLGKLNGLVAKCNQDKNPIKCKAKLDNHLQKTIRDLQIQKDNVTAYTKELETEKREEQLKAQMKADAKERKLAKKYGVPQTKTTPMM
jgi:hypothetical protein